MNAFWTHFFFSCRPQKEICYPMFFTAYVFDEVNDIWCHWGSLFKHAIDDHAPSKRVNLKCNHLPWINQTIQKQMRLRNYLYGKFRRFKSRENWNNYRLQRNKVTALKRQAVKDFCLEAVSVSSRGSTGSFWRKLRPLLPNNKPSDNSSKICLL